ncbi:hypothetical protein GUITHDRAFT_114403 [Guillardia theta CCMP2712]|uniref:EF-hand domain-containing protein n=1 Tax=Guillardia theta (strain CCMP2712) TaxID=905079 RepID=L1IT83_GUITC|nr:hypothetical protein GUITHDRAFT_114403 [Guillardia theta CCMP2712]EKX39443.1 hypothetical protein GUITHDRAFT_114403 [Guillardia theta CCMP2712]|eukprot:XP_005826423.1 hypothetical protein GUITHDRAFT_114403 [Guillardia theta CCMP2712]
MRSRPRPFSACRPSSAARPQSACAKSYFNKVTRVPDMSFERVPGIDRIYCILVPLFHPLLFSICYLAFVMGLTSVSDDVVSEASTRRKSPSEHVSSMHDGNMMPEDKHNQGVFVRRFLTKGMLVVGSNFNQRSRLLSHFSVAMNQKPDEPGSYMRMYYSDYLETEPAKLELEEENGACDIELLSEWLLSAIPKTRVDAYPMLLLLKDVFRRFVKKESRIISKQIDELQRQLELTRISLARKEEENESLRENLSKSEGEVARLTGISSEYQNLKTIFEQSENLRKQRENELKELQEQMAKEQQVLMQKAEDKQREMKAFHDADMRSQANRHDQQMHEVIASAESTSKRLMEVELLNKNLQLEVESLKKQLNQALASDHPSTVTESDPLQTWQSPDSLKAFLTHAEIVDQLYSVFIDMSHAGEQTQSTGKFDRVKQVDWEVVAQQAQGKLASDFWSSLAHMMGNHIKKVPGTSFAHFLQELVSLLEKNMERITEMESKIAEYEANEAQMREEISQLKKREEEYQERAKAEETRAATPEPAAATEMVRTESMKRMPTVKDNLLQMRRASFRIDNKIFRGKKITAARFDQVIQLSAAIYEGKALADTVDDREHNQRQSMPEYIREFLINKFGLRSIALTNLQSLILGVEKFSEGENFNLRVKTFGLVSGILYHPYWHEDLSDFVVGALAFLFNLNSIKESLDNIRNQNPCIDPTAAMQATMKAWLKYGFGQFPEKMEEEIGETIKKHEGDLPLHEWMAMMTQVWLQKSEEHDRFLRGKFEEHDTNGDNVLDLQEFEMLVMDVGGGHAQDPNRYHVSKLFMQALQENSKLKGTDDSEDAMCPEAFVKVARRARLGMSTSN